LVVCGAGAPPLLDLVGARYAAHGVTLLRLIGLSSPFTALVVLYATLVWLEQRVWLLAGFQACAGALLLALALLLLRRLGLTGIGWAYFVTQVATAGAVTPFTVRRIQRGAFRRAR
jgi:O-antigen/teichoic acid export membrane protein